MYGPPPVAGPARPTNTTAVLSLVFAFVFPPVGLILAIVAKSQLRRTGEEGAGLATAGLVLGITLTVLAVVVGVVLVVVYVVALFALMYSM